MRRILQPLLTARDWVLPEAAAPPQPEDRPAGVIHMRGRPTRTASPEPEVRPCGACGTSQAGHGVRYADQIGHHEWMPRKWGWR
ncbi:hypothetical protein [Streptomonospora wellingtoniae]|uniref:Transposase n=1 Tax=Streptomonospora wellingtoniae TaxID=3075544 RepID=A0ABU2KUM5_9ACTN|nr:hypothetical protein [Streptomonospora sp. DSM 45055]MDT0302955.1 hypothetical protein [Streptomonospora sp. DSM 45055]